MLPRPRLVPHQDTAPHSGSRATTRLSLDAELPRLHAHARRLCARDADARDLVQDTVLRALTCEHQFEAGSNLRAWLRQIQLSVFVSRYRRGRRERKALERLAVDPCSWVQGDAPAPAIVVGSGVLVSLAALPEGFRRVVELVDLGGYEYRDAAETLGIPIGTVMSRLHRARRLLGDKLSEKAPVIVEQKAA